jgi:hypothetical protein
MRPEAPERSTVPHVGGVDVGWVWVQVCGCVCTASVTAPDEILDQMITALPQPILPGTAVDTAAAAAAPARSPYRVAAGVASPKPNIVSSCLNLHYCSSIN